MPELNFKITADDSGLKKTLQNVARISKETNATISKDIATGIDIEAKERAKAVKSTKEQQKASESLVKIVNEEAKAHDRARQAIDKKKFSIDAAGKISQLRPVQMSSSWDEVNRYKNSSPIASGTVVGPAATINAAQFEGAAKAASYYETVVKSANKSAVEGVDKTTEAVKRLIICEDHLKLKLESYKSFRGSTTDPALYSEYTRKIAETKAEIQKLNNVGKRGYDELGNRIKGTIGQQEILTNKLKYFQDQLQYAKAPQSFVALNKKIEETKEQLDRLANAGKKGFDDLGNKINVADSSATKFLNTLKSIGAAILAAFSIQMILSWGKEARELAARGEGIREAFSRLGNTKTLQLLRDATRGATTDIDLMAAALRAKNFQIAPELLAKGLALAGRVSRQTGQDVTYLADSFVNGLGRKSLLILDNLQISQVQLRAEIKKTGDFQTAVANVVDAKLKAMGEVAETSADRMAQWTTKIANMKERVGQVINLAINYDGLREAYKEFYETGLAVQSLQNNIAPLLIKFDQLSAKAEKNGGVTKLNKVEQALMKDIIKQVGDEIPGAITQFDKYGNAIAISTKRAKEFIEQQVLVLQALNEDRIKKTVDRIDELRLRLIPLKRQLDELSKTGQITITASSSSGAGISSSVRAATKAEQAAIIKRYSEISRTIAQQEALRDADSGKLLKKRQEENDRFAKINKTDDGSADEKARKAQERQDAADAAALAAQESLQQRIQELKDKYERKGFSKEQEARQAIVDEFKKLAFDIEQQSKKYDAYAKKYGDARALRVLGPKQTTDQLEPLRKAAIDDLQYRQETARFEIALDKQKTAYENYENWKRTFGTESAKRRFGDELDLNTSYLKVVQDKYAKLVAKQALGLLSGKALTGPEQEELDVTSKRLYAGNEAQKAKETQDYTEAYQAALTYNQKVEKLNEDYRKKAKDLGSTITDEQKVELNYQRDQAINSAKDEALAKTAIYRKLAEDTILLSRNQVKEQIKALETVLSKGGLPNEIQQKIEKEVSTLKLSLKIGVDEANLQNLQSRLELLNKQLTDSTDKDGNSLISKEEFKRILTDLGKTQSEVDKLLNKTSGGVKSKFGQGLTESFKYLNGDAKEVSEGLFNDLSSLSGGFNELSNSLGGTDTQAGYLLGTIGELVKVGSDAAGAFTSFASGDIVGGITKTISAVSGLFSISSKVKEMNLKARKEQSDFYAAVIKGEMDYQALLRKRDVDSAARGKNSYKAIIDQLETLKRQSPEIEKAYNRIFSALQGQEFTSDVGYKHGTWLRKAKTWDIMSSLAGSDYNKLEELYSQGKLKDQAKTDFEALRQLRDELEAAGISVENLQEDLKQLLTGTSNSGLADGLKSLFENGKRSAQDFGDSFEEIMRNALLSTFEAKYLQDALKPFYEELATMMEGGTPTEDEIAALKNKYVEIGKNADEYLKNIEKITGTPIGNDDSSALKPNTLTASLNQPTGERLEGLWRGNFDLTKTLVNLATQHLDILKPLGQNAIEQLNVSRNILDYAIKTAENTGRTANNTDGISSKLDQIITNTKQPKNTRD